jgi:hypothetical protein
LSAEDFIRIDNEIQEVGNVEITDEEIISYVRPTLGLNQKMIN